MNEIRKIHPTDIFLSYEIRDKLATDILPKLRKWFTLLKSEDKKRDAFKVSKNMSIRIRAFSPMKSLGFSKWKSLAQAGAFICNHTISPKDIGDKKKLSRYIHKKIYPNRDYDQVRTFVELAFDARKDCTRMLKEAQTMIGEGILISQKYDKYYKDEIDNKTIKFLDSDADLLLSTKEMKEAFME